MSGKANPKVKVRQVTEQDREAWVDIFAGEQESYDTFRGLHPSSETVNFTFDRFVNPDVAMHCFIAVIPVESLEEESLSSINKKRIGANNELIVGFANLIEHPSTTSVYPVMYLADLFVSKTLRSGGIGRALFNEIYKFSDELGCDRFYWKTEQSNHSAQLLYTKIGKAEGFVTYRRPVTGETPDIV